MNIVDFKGEERFRFLMGDKQIYWSWVANKFVTPVMSSKSAHRGVVDKHELNDMYTKILDNLISRGYSEKDVTVERFFTDT